MAFLKGTSGGDDIVGNVENDYLLGLGGGDSLGGGGGADRVYGGEGDDTIDDGPGGDAGDALFGQAGDDTIVAWDGQADFIDGGYGADYYIAGGNGLVIDLLNQSLNAGTAAGDRLVSMERFRGADGSDVFRGSSANERFDDWRGNDFYNGRLGTDIYTATFTGIMATGVDFEIAFGSRADDLADLGNVTLSTAQSGVAAYIIWNDANFDGIRTANELSYEIDEILGIEHYLSPGMGAKMAGSAANEVFYCSNPAASVDGGGGANDFVAFGGLGFAGAMIIDLAEGTATDGVNTTTLTRIESVMGSNAADEISGNSLANSLVGIAGDDFLNGRAGNDRLDGGMGIDLLLGGDGNDVLLGGADGDLLDGGDGIDTACYVGSANGVEVNLATGANGAGQGDGDYFVSVENVIASRASDQVQGNGAANLIEGREGTDHLGGGGGDDRIYGGFAPGSAVAPDITSFDPGAKIGNDPAIDEIDPTSENNYLRGHGGNDTLVGGLDRDYLYGGLGNDRLDGGGGDNDWLYGGLGDDTYIVRGGTEVIVERSGEGVDRVLSSVSHELDAQVENLVLTGARASDAWGNSGANFIAGNQADNIMSGEQGNDTISGGAGNDNIAGGRGTDALTGGAGRDWFRFDSGLDGSINIDVIQDFIAADDTIILDRAIFDALGTDGRISAAALRVGTAAGDANDRIIYDQATGRIFYDADGTGSEVAVQFARIDAGTVLTAADFVALTDSAHSPVTSDPGLWLIS